MIYTLVKFHYMSQLNKALHKYGNGINHEIFLHYLHQINNNTWYCYGYDDFETNWRKAFELFFPKHGIKTFQFEGLYS